MTSSRPSPGKGAAPPLWRTYLGFLGPMLLANLLQSLSGTVGAIFIGQMLGVKALAAVASFFPVLFFFIAFVIGLGAGASVLIGQAWGARKPERVKAVAGTALSVVIVFGLVIAVFGGTFTEWMLGMLGTPPDILDDAVRYARIMLMATPGLLVFLLSTSMLRGVGDTVSPMLALCLSTLVNIILTPALIQGWAGLPRLGVTAGAWGTIASYAVALLWLGWRLRNRAFRGGPHPMAPDAALRAHLRIERGILQQVLRIGVPTGVQMIAISLSEIAVQWLVNRFGSQATAAYGAVAQIINYVQFPAISIAITASILAAQSIGAGHLERLPRIVRTGLWMNLALTGSLVLLGYLLSRPIVALFIADPAVLEVTQTLLHSMLWSLVIFGMSGVLSGVMRASGSVLVPTAITITGILVIQVPLAWMLSAHYGLNGIWYAYPAAFACMLAGQTLFYHRYWRKQPIRRLI